MLELLKIVVPFLLGLIPFFVNIFYQRKVNEENSKQQYRIKFYERQLESLCQIHIALNAFHKAMHHKYSTFGISTDWIKKGDDKALTELYQEANRTGGKALLALVEIRDKYEILLPTILASVLNEYIQVGGRYYAYDVFKNSQVGKDIYLTQSDDDFREMWSEQNNRFNQLLIWIRLLIGVEGISDKILSQVKTQNDKYTISVKDYSIK
jgi:hypothetical protein